MAAPVCHVPTGPSDPNTPATTLPAIPIAQPNIQSLTNTVNALRAALMTMTNQNGTDNGTTQGVQNNFRTATNDKKKVQWIEQSRKIEKVRIFQNDDKTSENYVDVEQINQLVMVDRRTGQTWTWDRKRR